MLDRFATALHESSTTNLTGTVYLFADALRDLGREPSLAAELNFLDSGSAQASDPKAKMRTEPGR